LRRADHQSASGAQQLLANDLGVSFALHERAVIDRALAGR